MDDFDEVDIKIVSRSATYPEESCLVRINSKSITTENINTYLQNLLNGFQGSSSKLYSWCS